MTPWPKRFASRAISRYLLLLILHAGLAVAPTLAQRTKIFPPQNQNVSVTLPGTAQVNDEISEVLALAA